MKPEQKDDRRNKVLEIRQKVYQRFKDDPLFDPFILEKKASSVFDLNSTYLQELTSSNVIIFLIDSDYDIPSGVVTEMDEARRQNKKRIFFIFSNSEEQGENFRRKNFLEKGDNFWINITTDDELENVVDGILTSVRDIFVRSQIATDEPDSVLLESTHFAGSYSSKIFKQTDAVNLFFSELIFNGDLISPTEYSSKIDEFSFSMINRIFYNIHLPSYWADNFLKAISDEYPGLIENKEFRETLKKRLKIIEIFYDGNSEESFELLKNVYKSDDFEKLPDWYKQDILIDLRNLEAVNDEKKNQRHSDSVYQRELNAIDSQFYNPATDYLLNDVNSWVNNQSFSIQFQKPTTNAYFGIGATRYAHELANVIILAMVNGSLTKIRNIANQLKAITKMLLLKFETKESLVTVLYLLTLSSSGRSQFDDLTSKFDYLLNKISDSEANHIINASNSNPVDCERIMIRASSLSIVGNYLTDENFGKIWSKTFTEIMKWSKDDNPPNLVSSLPIFNLFRELYRIPEEDLIEFINFSSHNFKIHYSEIFKIIYFAIDYENLNSKYRTQIIDDVKWMIINNRDKGTIPQEADQCIHRILSEWPTEAVQFKSFLSTYNINQYENRISLLDNSSTDDQMFWNKFILRIKTGLNPVPVGIYMSSSTNLFLAAYNFLNNKYNIKADDERSLFSLCVKALTSNEIDNDGKISSAKLILSIIGQSRSNERYIEYLKDNFTGIIFNQDSFDAEFIPTTVINGIENLFHSIIYSEDKSNFLKIFTIDSSDRFNHYISEIYSDYLRIILKNEKLQYQVLPFVQILMTQNDPHDKRKILKKVAECLTILVNDEKFTDIAINQINSMIDDGSENLLRCLIIYMSTNISIMNDKVESIKNRLKASQNYAVRTLAIRDFK